MSMRAIFAAARKGGITQRQIATTLGVTESAVSKWASGLNAVPPHLMRDLADLLGVPVERLVPFRADVAATEPEESAP